MELRQALEEALSANPDDLAAHSAYADLLAESSGPAESARGEFCQVQLALERAGADGAERQALERRESALLGEHLRTWLGEPLAVYLIDHYCADLPSYLARSRIRGRFTFARGWLDTLHIHHLTRGLAEAIVTAPDLRLLRELTAGGIVGGEDCTRPLTAAPPLSNLRSLGIGSDETTGCGGGESVVQLVRNSPRLESLVLMVHRVDTDTLFSLPTLTRLRGLKVYHLSHYPLELLAANPSLGQLTHLRLKPHALVPGDENAYITLDGVRALVESPHLRSLTHLELRQSDMGDEGCEAIVNSGILKRLKELSLASGRITDRGARLLAGCPDVRNLEKLDLENNLLTNAGIAALQAAGVDTRAVNQRDPDRESDELDEDHYLFEGDWE